MRGASHAENIDVTLSSKTHKGLFTILAGARIERSLTNKRRYAPTFLPKNRQEPSGEPRDAPTPKATDGVKKIVKRITRRERLL